MATWIPESASRSAGATGRSLGPAGILTAIAREPVALIGLVMVATYVAIALFVSFLPLRDPILPSTQRLLGPSLEFPFGTDALGRDLLSRVLHGSRLSIEVAVLSVTIATFVGGILGLVSGYLGGVADLVIGRVMDVFFAFPAILLALGIVAALGPDPRDVSSHAVVYTPISHASAASGACARRVTCRAAATRERRRASSRATNANSSRHDRAGEPRDMWAVPPRGRARYLGSQRSRGPSWGMLNPRAGST